MKSNKITYKIKLAKKKIYMNKYKSAFFTLLSKYETGAYLILNETDYIDYYDLYDIDADVMVSSIKVSLVDELINMDLLELY